MEQLLLQISEFESWRIALIATWLILQGAFVTIFPEEVISVTLGVLWAQGRISFPEAMVAVQMGLLPANAIGVYIGQRFGHPILKRRPFSWIFDEKDVHEALNSIRNNSKKVIFTTRFLPMVRGPIYFATGMSKIGVFNFSKVDFLASLVQVPALLLLGRWIGTRATSLIEAYQKVGIILLVLIAWTIAFSVIRRKRRKAAARTSEG